jgi:DNA-directed RNA polymerase subunit RPC12/RpoP
MTRPQPMAPLPSAVHTTVALECAYCGARTFVRVETTTADEAWLLVTLLPCWRCGKEVMP